MKTIKLHLKAVNIILEQYAKGQLLIYLLPGQLCPSVHSDGTVRHLDVGSSYPGAGEGPKGLAVRQLKRYASWVQTVVRQVGLLSTAGVDN